jgi:dTMP kinase
MGDRRKGFLITIEGIDGIGKTTQARMLSQFLQGKGYHVVELREPTDSVWGKKIRDLTKHGRDASPKEECRWFLEDRKLDVSQNIIPALNSGKIIVMDRYYYSNMAYQGALGLDMERIRSENEKFAPRPDLVMILDSPPKTGLDRIRNKRKEELNYFETLEYQEKVRNLFLRMKDYDNVRVLDGSGTIEEVSEKIRELVMEMLRM